MSGKQARKIRKAYNAAGALYWTADMEKIIRKTRAELMAWRIAGPCCILVAVFIVILGGV